ncbi:MAG: undecaprenyl-diphosphatase UppP [Armatimonadetes bacterium]|nr:undecaprenyl-diphosphatase UppP [Armatimonadota bacterium]
MQLLEPSVLGVLQGLTEFLPISSSGHLILVPRAMGWVYHGRAFDVALHLGTFLALVIYFWRDLLRFGRSLLPGAGGEAATDRRVFVFLLVSTIPGILVGLKFDNLIEEKFSGTGTIALFFLAFGLLLAFAEYISRKKREFADISFLDACLIGIAQALALFPGVSRSGITMTTGLFLGLTRESAARFSFLMSIPIIGGAGVYEGAKLATHGGVGGEWPAFLVGFAASALSGYFCIKYLLRFLQNGKLYVFSVYRIIVAVAVLLFLRT